MLTYQLLHHFVNQRLSLRISTFFIKRKDIKDIILCWVFFTLTSLSYSFVCLYDFTYYYVLAIFSLMIPFENLFSCCFIDNDIGYARSSAFGKKK